MTDLVFDGERINPEEMRQTAVMRAFVADHLQRYRLAQRYVVGRCVLDAACGSGYGSAMLQTVSGRSVVGVDYSIEALRYARQRYGRPGVLFVQADLDRFDWPYGAFEAVVSLETVEHLRKPRDFIRRVYERLPPGGVFAVSTPVTPFLAVDRWHLHEWDEAEVLAMVTGEGFVIVDQLRTQQSFTGHQTLQPGWRQPQAISLRHALRYPLKSLSLALYGWRGVCVLMLVANKT